MRTASLFFITVFVSWLTLMAGLGQKNPFPNFGAFLLTWIIYYLLTAPRRRRRQYWQQRRALQDEYMRCYIRMHRKP